jgi:hypothetical protein
MKENYMGEMCEMLREMINTYTILPRVPEGKRLLEKM